MLVNRVNLPNNFRNFSIVLRLIFLKALFVTGLTIFSVSPLHAEMLSKQQCKDLRAKYEQLKLLDPVKNMEKGFEWVKLNVRGSELLDIKTFIETEEQIRFRCKKLKKKKIAKPKKKDSKKANLTNKLTDKKQAKSKKSVKKKKVEPKKTSKKKPVKKKPVKKVSPKKKTSKPKKKTEKQPEPTLLDDLIATIQDATQPETDKKQP